ncbi:MAG: hypothetical protein VXW97_02115 [Pseudomonadota bacterium]|nr:hypothetical protein [Pseudomonadota bacterium]
MRNISKYLKVIDASLDKLIENRDLIKNAKENLSTINNLEDQIKKNKNIKIETIELIDQIIDEIENITFDNNKKSK